MASEKELKPSPINGEDKTISGSHDAEKSENGQLPTDVSTDDEVVHQEIGTLPPDHHQPPKSLVVRIWEWKPPPARYDPDKPPKFTLLLNLLFAFVRDNHSAAQHCLTASTCKLTPEPRWQAATFTVANLYYNQAVLYRIAETFNIGFENASTVATLMQAGYASGLLLICPLGDIFPRRPFIVGLMALTATLVSAHRIKNAVPDS
jgi:hypothetical protein